MNKPFSLLHGITIVLMFAITACTMAAPEPAATVEPTATNTPVPPTAASTPSPTLTPTPIPMASVNDAVDCYAGPSAQYDQVTSLEIGAEIQVTGESDSGTFWIVITTDGKECWLAKEHATMINGETAALPQVAPPATPTLSPPTAPSELTVTTSCRIKKATEVVAGIRTTAKWLEPSFVIYWKDNSSNEDGYIIYKHNNEVVRLAANSTQYGDGDRFSVQRRTSYQGPEMIYAVAAFNRAGVSVRVEISVRLSCP